MSPPRLHTFWRLLSGKPPRPKRSAGTRRSEAGWERFGHVGVIARTRASEGASSGRTTEATLKILYLLTTPPPVVPRTDAVVQEVDLLRARFGGEVIYMRPSWRARARYPRPLFGLHCLGAIRRWDQQVDVHHVYAPQLFRLPVLRFVKRPVVYTVTSSVGPEARIPPASYLRRFQAIAVPSGKDLDTLTRYGLGNVHLIRGGIDVTRFVDTPPPPGPEFTVLSGSAPWTRQQFRSKGVDALLAVAREMPDLRLVFLWRGLLLSELVARVDRAGVSERVEVVRDWIDVSQVLTRVHAAVVLVERPDLIRAYPHSLLEALAAGRPLLVSDGNPMAEYVRETRCGRVVPGLGTADLIAAIRELRQSYEAYRARACEAGRKDFTEEAMVAAYRDLYHSIAR